MAINREDAAWAAGFFEGEGCVSAQPSGYVILDVGQADTEPLEKFKECFNCGMINGPIMKKDGRSKKPFYKWNTYGFERVQYVIAVMWPWLSERRKQRATEVLLRERSITRRRYDHPEGAKATDLHCKRGHPSIDYRRPDPRTGKKHCKMCEHINYRRRFLKSKGLYVDEDSFLLELEQNPPILRSYDRKGKEA